MILIININTLNLSYILNNTEYIYKYSIYVFYIYIEQEITDLIDIINPELYFTFHEIL